MRGEALISTRIPKGKLIRGNTVYYKKAYLLEDKLSKAVTELCLYKSCSQIFFKIHWKTAVLES